MKFFRLSLAFAMAAILLVPLISKAETKTGDIALTIDAPKPAGAAPTVTLGTKVKVACDFSAKNFFGMSVIVPHANLENTSQEKIYYSYSVAFFDADHNLLGASGQSSGNQVGLQPGDKLQIGTSPIFLPPDQISKVKSFQVTWYESTEPAGL